MSRAPNASDFVVPIDDLGTFSFAKRSMRDQFRIHAEFARLTEGVEPVPEDLLLAAMAVSALKVLTVAAPDDWDVDAMDPLDDGTFAKLMKAFSALRAAEEKFRDKRKAGSKGDGAPAVADPGVLVPAQVQLGAD